jgi:hypothetical protein
MVNLYLVFLESSWLPDISLAVGDSFIFIAIVLEKFKGGAMGGCRWIAP